MANEEKKVETKLNKKTDIKNPKMERSKKIGYVYVGSNVIISNYSLSKNMVLHEEFKNKILSKNNELGDNKIENLEKKFILLEDFSTYKNNLKEVL
ncbi:MAG: hypothetical protein LBT51_01235 [Fusobacteriaceae bacterium]|jgi:hypothetical protein|nr:hypothetical protein [Fusobacteriaceae bacterium]